MLTRNAARCSLREHLSYIIIQKTDPVTISIICSLYSFNNNLEWLSWSYQPTFVPTTLPKSHSLGHKGVQPYSWVSEALDFIQMLMDIRKQLKINISIIPNNFYFNNIAKKSFPGTHQGPALLLGVRGSGPGPGPDGHGHFAPMFSESVDQELSFETLTLSLLSKLKKFHLFFSLLLTQIII